MCTWVQNQVVQKETNIQQNTVIIMNEQATEVFSLKINTIQCVGGLYTAPCLLDTSSETRQFHSTIDIA